MRGLGLGLVIGIVIAVVAIWYFGFYDTAAGRCERGDLGACLVEDLRTP